MAIKASKLKGKSGQVQVVFNGRTVAKKAVFIDSDNFFVEEDFNLKAGRVGQNKLVVSLTTFDNEENKANNEATSYIEVIDGKRRLRFGQTPGTQTLV